MTAAEANAPAPRSKVGPATLIALVFTLAGPPIGAVIAFPLAAIASMQFSPDPVFESAIALILVLPLAFIFSYVMAGSIALVTGISIALISYRRGIVSIAALFAATMLVFGAFLLLQQVLHGSIPGATLLRGEGRVGPGLGAIISILSSLACWRMTRPLQRRLA